MVFSCFLAAGIAGAAAPEGTVRDTGWDATDPEPASGPIAVGPVDSRFSGFTETVVYAVGSESVVVTWAGPSREAAGAGVVLPVTPETTREDLVSLSLDSLGALDRWTRPWLWEETCGQALEAPPSGCGGRSQHRADRGGEPGCSSAESSSGCAVGTSDSSSRLDTGRSRDTASAGDAFALGAYRAWLPTLESGSALLEWLEQRELAQPPGLLPTADAWIAAGGSFLVLRLDAEAIDSEVPLPAVQAIVRGNAPPLPVGMGSLGGDDARDLVVQVLHASDPWVPALPLAGPWDCLLEVENRNATVVSEALAAAWHTATGIAQDDGDTGASQPRWSPEAWLPDGKCSDCQITDRLPDSVLRILGHDDISVAIQRSRVRFDRRAVSGPAVLEPPGDVPPRGVKRVIESRWELTGLLPACDGSEAARGGTCFSAAWWAERAVDDRGEREEISLDERRCGRGRGALVLILPLFLAGLRRRT